MDRYQLATLSSWAGPHGIQGRKRLQKVVFFLQAAGCSLDCRFSLHHYGPYSRDVANACDEMVAVGLFQEEVTANPAGARYGYRLTPQAVRLLAVTEQTEPFRSQSMNPYRDLGAKLLGEDLWRLELGSTILFFYPQSRDWNLALQRACEFKKVPQGTPATAGALELAREVSRAAVATPA
jgi:hypothetical protein